MNNDLPTSVFVLPSSTTVDDLMRVVSPTSYEEIYAAEVAEMDRDIEAMLTCDGHSVKSRFPAWQLLWRMRATLEERNHEPALIEIGRLCRWTGGTEQFSGQPLGDMREIRRIVEEVTGMSFEEYT